MYFFDADGHLGWTALWWFFGALLAAGLFHGLLQLARRRDVKRDPSNAPRAILRRKYVRGEIDRPTFVRLRRELKESERQEPPK